jgi:pimeloyl-ACP methyl ester carboxylesterase
MKKIAIIYLALLILSACDPGKFTEKDIYFTSERDGTNLAGTIAIPKSEEKVPAVALIHDSGNHDRDLSVYKHKVFKDLAEYLSSKGIAVLRYDKRGAGKSGGTYIPYDLESFTHDGLAAMEYLAARNEIDPEKIGAIGLGQGGIITPMMATQSSMVKYIVILGGVGVPAREELLASQMAISKAAGFKGEALEEVSKIFDEYWALIIKRNLSPVERQQCITLLRNMWRYIDEESRKDFAFLDENAEFFLDQLYHTDKLLEFYTCDPRETLLSVECPVLAITGEKDLQAPAIPNIAAISDALENGTCPDHKIMTLKDHNHLFQKCETGKISEYKNIDHAISNESMGIIVEWILEQ